jgi:thiamine pyrophosphate-dependent acetolactate synthase large subunit-like protein
LERNRRRWDAALGSKAWHRLPNARPALQRIDENPIERDDLAMPDFEPTPHPGEFGPDDAPHGGFAVARALREGGANTVFTLCGGHIAAVLDACHDLEIRTIDHRHEGAACLAAEGFALATGKVGVAVITAGAGFTNALTGLADAGVWSVPLVMLAGHAQLRQTGRGAVQEAPQLAMAAPVAKKALTCVDPKRLGRTTSEALHVARSGRPGPVYCELPQDVLSAKVAPPDPDAAPFGHPRTAPISRASKEDVAAALTLLESATRPIIVAGSGAFWSGAGDALARFAEAAKIPVVTTSAARGVLPDSHPMCLGGLIHAGIATASADVVVVLGSAFNANLCFGGSPLFQSDQKIIQVDLAPDALGGDRAPAIAVASDVRCFLTDLFERFARAPAEREAWLEDARGMTGMMRASWDEQIAAHRGRRLHAGSVARDLCAWAREQFGGEVTFVADGGDALLWALAYTYAEGPGRILTTTTALGTLGVGLPFAIGAKVARPGEPVILFSGDGAFGFSAMEIESAVRQKLPIICIISNNHGWRDVSHEQDAWFGKGRRFASELSDTRWDKLAEALGGHGEHVTRLDQLRPALERAYTSGTVSVINVETDPEVLSDLLRNLGAMGLN